MSRIAVGLVLGAACAVVAAAAMIPLKFPSAAEKRRAIVGAILNRAELGFIVCNIDLPMPRVLAGAVLGLAVSASAAVISRAYAPILVMGTAMGALVAWIAPMLA